MGADYVVDIALIVGLCGLAEEKQNSLKDIYF